ncbi:OmpA family protein [Cyclobacterium qasimii]|uniref:Outer membrane protein OmpA n=2 Tax=Cyclobacterium qasimii TaxID=1350429 RepID=S7VKW9_9BACT|nr:OmpA family protein [Cyclobacterium qasimii]EPR70815.1 outer membrane protein OmpA [Cyclobacterium qasimii M12-11B]GEO24075.1 hypothetical protein CQA01_46090 [Cyclobacterium qasimii]
MFRTIFLLLGLLIGQASDLSAQLNPYKLRIGAGIGYSNYYGDLSNYRHEQFLDWNALGEAYSYNVNYNQTPSLSLSIEQRISASWGLLLSGGQYTLSMSDRFLDKEDRLQLEMPNFNRALNFETQVRDLGLGFVFRTDNGKILLENSLVAPYFTASGGWMQFKPKGDLLDANGNQYDYSQNTLETDGVFETDLSKLQASSDNGYKDNTFYLAAGIGLRLRLTKQIELYVQSDVKRTNTDYIDDVDGASRTIFTNDFQEYAAYPGIVLSPGEPPFRGDAQNNKDWFFNHHFGIKISLFPSKTAFRANPISPSSTIIRTITELKAANSETDTLAPIMASVKVKNSNGIYKENEVIPEGIAVSTKNNARETPTEIGAVTNTDSTLTFSVLNSQSIETAEGTDSVVVWQYPFRRTQEEMIYPQETENVYRRYNENTVVEANEPYVGGLYLESSKGQGSNYNIPYPMPYYSQSSTVNRPNYSNNIAPLDSLDSMAIGDTTAFAYLDSTEMAPGTGFKAVPGKAVGGQKYKFAQPILSTRVAVPLPLSNPTESTAELIENGFYAEIYFESNKSTLSENEVLKLVPLVKRLNQTPKAKILVKGFADNTGSTSYNLTLIEKRAAVVEESLLNQFGVDKDKIARQPGALLIRGSKRSSRPEDRKVEVQVLY